MLCLYVERTIFVTKGASYFFKFQNNRDVHIIYYLDRLIQNKTYSYEKTIISIFCM